MIKIDFYFKHYVQFYPAMSLIADAALKWDILYTPTEIMLNPINTEL
jgi:hypothetical protein